MGKLMLCSMLCIFLVATQTIIPTATETTSTTSTTTVGTIDEAAGILGILTSTDKLTTTPKSSTPEVSTLGTGQYSKDILEEFEASLKDKQQDRYMMYRSEASGNKTVHVTANNSDKKYETILCVKGSGDKKVQLQVLGILYSNDGPSDTISVELDGKSLGSAKTEEVYNGGYDWNVFRDTGAIGEATALDNGNHTLTMAVKTDQWGAEFDSITVRVHNQDPEATLFCGSKFV